MRTHGGIESVYVPVSSRQHSLKSLNPKPNIAYSRPVANAAMPVVAGAAVGTGPVQLTLG